MVRPGDPTLHHRPVAFEGVGVDFAVYVMPLAVRDGYVIRQALYPAASSVCERRSDNGP